MSYKPRLLLTNDDGPPHVKDSPYILGLYQRLTEHFDVKVVLPSSQKSWIGTAHHIRETIKGVYFYPIHDGTGETSLTPRPLKHGELGEWILLDGTPATCVNIALHNLFPDEIDLVVSGPNLGRNSSAALALSSGTIGAALSSSLSKIRSIALSYGTVLHPTPTKLFEPAHRLGSSIIRHLWNNWGLDQGGLRNGEVDLYNINIPLIEDLLTEEGLKICTTTMWRNSYGRLFKSTAYPRFSKDQAPLPAGPDALDVQVNQGKSSESAHPGQHDTELSFKFSPNMTDLITPSLSSLPAGSDGWALYQGWVSVTPLRASFEASASSEVGLENRIWKLKL